MTLAAFIGEPKARKRGPYRQMCSTKEWVRKRVTISDSGYETPCWIWQYARNREGYGITQTFVDGRLYYSAHRVAYLAYNGPIPDGFEIDHVCRVRLCCNPAHLEAVTGLENIRRSRPYHAAALRKTHCKLGHALEGGNLRITAKGGRLCRECYLASQRKHDRKRRPRRSK